MLNTLRPRQNGCHFPDDIFKWIFLNENVWISLEIPLKFVPRGPINNIPALVQVMAWRRPGEKPLSEPMLVFVPTHICVTRPQWFNIFIQKPYSRSHCFSFFVLNNISRHLHFHIASPTAAPQDTGYKMADTILEMWCWNCSTKPWSPRRLPSIQGGKPTYCGYIGQGG